MIQRCAVAALLMMWVPPALAQTGRASGAPDLSGVYKPISGGTVLPGGLKNAGSPSEISLVPAAAQRAKATNVNQDPLKMCQPIGPFRMMAREDTIIELVPARGMLLMLFEDVSHGLLRTIYMDRPHPARMEPTWLGDSVGRWEGDTLVIDTVGFNERTWLNDAGAQHSEALHLIERIRSVLSGKYLEYRATADDPQALTRPYTYTRYFEKLTAEIEEDICEQ